MKFGGKQSMADKMAVADALLGKHTGASKGSKPPPKPKVKPVIGKEELTVLKKGVILINTARGGVFDEDALIEGLNSGQIGGAGLDVFIGEPTPRADILTHPKVALTPHVGGSTAEAQENVGRELAGLIIDHFSK